MSKVSSTFLLLLLSIFVSLVYYYTLIINPVLVIFVIPIAILLILYYLKRRGDDIIFEIYFLITLLLQAILVLPIGFATIIVNNYFIVKSFRENNTLGTILSALVFVLTFITFPVLTIIITVSYLLSTLIFKRRPLTQEEKKVKVVKKFEQITIPQKVAEERKEPVPKIRKPLLVKPVEKINKVVKPIKLPERPREVTKPAEIKKPAPSLQRVTLPWNYQIEAIEEKKEVEQKGFLKTITLKSIVEYLDKIINDFISTTNSKYSTPTKIIAGSGAGKTYLFKTIFVKLLPYINNAILFDVKSPEFIQLFLPWKYDGRFTKEDLYKVLPKETADFVWEKGIQPGITIRDDEKGTKKTIEVDIVYLKEEYESGSLFAQYIDLIKNKFKGFNLIEVPKFKFLTKELLDTEYIEILNNSTTRSEVIYNLSLILDSVLEKFNKENVLKDVNVMAFQVITDPKQIFRVRIKDTLVVDTAKKIAIFLVIYDYIINNTNSKLVKEVLTTLYNHYMNLIKDYNNTEKVRDLIIQTAKELFKDADKRNLKELLDNFSLMAQVEKTSNVDDYVNKLVMVEKEEGRLVKYFYMRIKNTNLIYNLNLTPNLHDDNKVKIIVIFSSLDRPALGKVALITFDTPFTLMSRSLVLFDELKSFLLNAGDPDLVDKIRSALNTYRSKKILLYGVFQQMETRDQSVVSRVYHTFTNAIAGATQDIRNVKGEEHIKEAIEIINALKEQHRIRAWYITLMEERDTFYTIPSVYFIHSDPEEVLKKAKND
jgi:hypothetical protein